MEEFVPRYFYQNVTLFYQLEKNVLSAQIVETNFYLFSAVVNSTADKVTPRCDKCDVAQGHPI
jgi:hypothetical protein